MDCRGNWKSVRLVWLKCVIDCPWRRSLTTLRKEQELLWEPRNTGSITVRPACSVPHLADMSARLFTHNHSVAPVMPPAQQTKPHSSIQTAGLVSGLPRVRTDIVLYKYTHLHSSSKGSSINSLLHLTWVVLSLQPVLRQRGCSVIFIKGVLLCFKKVV